MKKLLLIVTVLMACTAVQAQEKVKKWTYGSHTYTMVGNLTAKEYNRSAKGTVTFTNIPSDYEEFESIYTNFLGKTPHGAAAMMTMAMEIYGRDRTEGRKCIKLLCYTSNVNAIIPRLDDKFDAAPGDSYGQRYLPAAVLMGATPENGYRPQKPYTIEMKASVNKHQDLQIVGSGRVMYLYVMGKGWDTEQRSVEIIRQPDNKLYQVFNCPALYTQCKQIRGTWGGLD